MFLLTLSYSNAQPSAQRTLASMGTIKGHGTKAPSGMARFGDAADSKSSKREATPSRLRRAGAGQLLAVGMVSAPCCFWKRKICARPRPLSSCRKNRPETKRV